MNVKLDVMIVKKAMAEKRVNGKMLSALTGISRNGVSLILSRGTCSLTSAGLIADALGMEIEEIVREG